MTTMTKPMRILNKDDDDDDDDNDHHDYDHDDSEHDQEDDDNDDDTTEIWQNSNVDVSVVTRERRL